MDTPVVIAIIAAGASLAGAGMAFYGAHRARESANQTNTLNHQIAVIDRDVDELRSAYRGFMESIGSAGSAKGGAALLGTLELLMASRAASQAIERHAAAIGQAMAARKSDGLDAEIKALRVAYTECQTGLESRRMALLKSQDR